MGEKPQLSDMVDLLGVTLGKKNSKPQNNEKSKTDEQLRKDKRGGGATRLHRSTKKAIHWLHNTGNKLRWGKIRIRPRNLP